MRLTIVRRAAHFGALGAHIRGIVMYKLSPFEQKPFCDCFTKGIPNFFHRGKQTVITWLPTFLFGIFYYYSMEELHRRMQRKDPADYLHEVDPNKNKKKVC